MPGDLDGSRSRHVHGHDLVAVDAHPHEPIHPPATGPKRRLDLRDRPMHSAVEPS
jgi:hypothetical protein